MVYFEMKFSPAEKLADFCESKIGRRPVVVGQSGTHTIQLEFDPPLSSSDKTTLMNAMPPWIKNLWTVEQKGGTLRTELPGS